jgi:hypothetical protein
VRRTGVSEADSCLLPFLYLQGVQDSICKRMEMALYADFSNTTQQDQSEIVRSSMTLAKLEQAALFPEVAHEQIHQSSFSTAKKPPIASKPPHPSNALSKRGCTFHGPGATHTDAECRDSRNPKGPSASCIDQ